MKTTIITVVVVILLLLGGWYAFNSLNVETQYQNNGEINNNQDYLNAPTGDLNIENDDSTAIMCTADVLQCSDGSFVGRIPPNCNFAACPVGTTPPTTNPIPPMNPPIFTPSDNK